MFWSSLVMVGTMVTPAPHRGPAPKVATARRTISTTRQTADSVVGDVTDSAGKPIEATISIGELERSTRADKSGHYRFLNVPDGVYTMTIRAFGYRPVIIEITVPAESPQSVKLEPSAFEIEPIVITTSRDPVAGELSPLSNSSLGEEALRRGNSISISHFLDQIAGVRTLSTGLQIGKPVIRGLTGQRVLVLDGGNRMEDYSWSSEDGPSLDAGLAERIEVIRGPASLLYGSDAVGGVVNAVPFDLPSPGSASRKTAGIYASSNNAETGLLFRMDGAGAKISWRGGAVVRRAGSLHTPVGELAHTGFLSISADAALGHHGSSGGWNLRLAHTGGEFKLLESNGPPGAGGEEEGPERKMLDDRLQFNLERVFPTWRIEAKTQYQRHSLIEMSDDAPGAPPGTEAKAFDLLLNTVTADVVGHFGPQATRLNIGINGVHQANDTRGPIDLVPAATLNSEAIFGVGELHRDRISVLAGARVDVRQLSAMTHPDKNDHAVGANVGAVYRAGTGLSFTGNVGRGWRAPNLFELYADGPRLGEARYEIGRADLAPETSMSYDVGIRYQERDLRVEVTGYQNEISDFIYITPTTDTIDGLRVYRYLQDDARLRGIEASAELDVMSHLTARVKGDGLHADNLAADEPLPLTPPTRVSVGLDYYRSESRGLGSFVIGGEVVSVAKQTRLNPLDIPTDGYALLNFHADLAHRLGGRLYHFDLNVRNAANKKYRDFLSRYKEFALSPGRDISLRISTDF